MMKNRFWSIFLKMLVYYTFVLKLNYHSTGIISEHWRRVKTVNYFAQDITASALAIDDIVTPEDEPEEHVVGDDGGTGSEAPSSALWHGQLTPEVSAL